MTQSTNIFTAIDVGTTKVCTIVGSSSGPKKLEVLAHSVVPCDGLRKGNVADVVATQRAIRASIEEVERLTGIKVESAYVGVAGGHVTFENRRDSVEWAGKRGVISAADVTHVPEAVAASSARAGRQVIHAIPMTYSLDGENGIRNPLGMHSSHFEVETHVVTGASPFIDKLVRAVEGAGISVESLVLEPLASSEAVLTKEEREEGVALVDIGGGTTDVVVFRRGAIDYTAVIPVGGYQFTNDICQTYNAPYDVAEETKLTYANTEPDSVGLEEEISLSVLDRKSELKVLRRDICQLTRERGQELMRLIKLKLQEAKVEDISKTQLVITGGTSSLPGLQGLLQRSLTHKVRVGVPNGRSNVPADLQAPAYSTGVGILLWAAAQRRVSAGAMTNGAGGEEPREGLLSRLFTQVRNLFSLDLFSSDQGRI